MNIRSLSLITTAGLCLAPAVGLHAGGPAMAFVSMERLFDNYHKTKAANIQLKARFEAMDASRRDLLNEVKTLQSEVEKLGADARDKSLSDAERAKRRAAAEDKFALFREAEAKLMEFDNTYKKQFGEQMQQSQQKLVAEIRAVIATYTAANKIRIVFDSSGKTLNNVESVVYYDPAFDITAPILAILNQNAAESQPANSTETKPIKKTP